MKIQELHPQSLEKVDNEELLSLHLRVHQLFGGYPENGVNIEDVVNAHHLIVQEMRKRGLNHNRVSPLDTMLKRKLKDILSRAENVVLVPSYISVTGSAVTESHPQDIDILVRDDPNRLSQGQVESLYLLMRKVFDQTGKKIHLLFNPQGPHIYGDQKYVPIFDLVLRPRTQYEEVGLSSKVKIDLGCGMRKPEGYIGVDILPLEGVDIVWDLEQGLPFPSNYADEIRAHHVLEHIENFEHLMQEIHRVLKPGGAFVFEVPSTNSEGAFAPGHKSFWNETTFLFWIDPHLSGTRPLFRKGELQEIERKSPSGKVYRYVTGVLYKPEDVEKRSIAPITRFDMQKPLMKWYVSTEAFEIEEVIPWFEKHKNNGIVAEPKYNGFRACIQKKGNRVSIWFEDSKKERAGSLPQLVEEILKIDGDVIIDCNIGIRKNGEMLSRIDIMTLLAEQPELKEDEYPVAILFDLLYWGEDIHERPFQERREALEELHFRYFEESKYIEISPQIYIETLDDIAEAYEEFGFIDNSEGIVLKDLSYPFELKQGTDGLSKIKHAMEIKVRVLGVQENKNGTYSYECGILPGDSGIEPDKGEYISLGKTFNTQIQAKEGDIITCRVQEIIIGEKSIEWLGATVLDVDATRSEPYYVRQVVDLAERSGTLEVRKGIKQIIASIGGKHNVIPKLLPKFPEHTVYVEPYAGGAALFFAKQKVKKEVLNDIDPKVVFVYRFFKNASDRDFKALLNMDWEGKIEKFKELYDSNPRSRLQKIYRLLYISRFGNHGIHSRRGHFRYPMRAHYTLEWFQKIRERLKDVAITRMDGIKCIRRYDSKDTFFFIDPPYVKTRQDEKYYQYSIDEEYMAKLIETLKGIKGKFMLTTPYRSIKDFDLPKNWTIYRYRIRYCSPTKPEAGLSYEVAVCNYDVAKKARLDEPTRGEVAQAIWNGIWHSSFPTSGKGKFVYHHHWRGLSKDEIEMSDEELLRTDHSLHGDLRFEFDKGLWGFSVFLGKAKDNRDGDRLIKGEPLRGAFKPIQPKEWLKVGLRKPYVSEPGGVGSTSKTYSKFFAIDSGTYEIGTWRNHFFEVFLHGKHLKGRYIISYVPVNGERIWMIQKPEDETPYADKYSLDEVIEELRRKGQRYLVWAKPGTKPVLIDVTETQKRVSTAPAQPGKSLSYYFSKLDSDYHYVWAPILVPNVIDADGEFVSKEEIEKAVHRFMQTDMPVYLMHEKPLDGKAKIVECATIQGKLVVHGEEYPPGTAVCGIAIYDDDLWKDIVSGKYKGLSIRSIVHKHNYGPYTELTNLVITEVSIVDNPAVAGAKFKVVKRAEVKEVDVKESVKDILEELSDLLPDAEGTPLYQAISSCVTILSQAIYGATYGYPQEEQNEKEAEKEPVKEEQQEKVQSEAQEEPVKADSGVGDVDKYYDALCKIEQMLRQLQSRIAR